MTTLREVAQQVLEALEEATSYTSCPTWSPSLTEECEAAASALRSALAEPTVTRYCAADSHQQATELRRLHAELERCKQVCAATAEGWRVEREELLEALKEIVDAADGTGWDQLDASFSKARAALMAAEGEKE